MTEQEIKYRKYVADLIIVSINCFLINENVTKIQYIEIKEYKQYLKDISLYNYELKNLPDFFKLSSYYTEQLDNYKIKHNINIDLNINL